MGYDKYKGAISTKEKIYIEDANGKFVDFTPYLKNLPAIQMVMENSFNNFYATANNCYMKNDDGFWDKPFPNDMLTLDSDIAKWNESHLFSIHNLLRTDNPAKVQFILEYTYPDGVVEEKVIGTFYVADLETDLTSTATLILTSAQKLLMDKKADDIKNGNFWYQYTPIWFLIREILKKAFGKIVDGKIQYPSSFYVPKDYFVPYEFDEAVFTKLGRPPMLIDTDFDGEPDGYSTEQGICRAVIKIDESTLFLAVDGILWELNLKTLIYNKVYDFNYETAGVLPKKKHPEIKYPTLPPENDNSGGGSYNPPPSQPPKDDEDIPNVPPSSPEEATEKIFKEKTIISMKRQGDMIYLVIRNIYLESDFLYWDYENISRQTNADFEVWIYDLIKGNAKFLYRDRDLADSKFIHIPLFASTGNFDKETMSKSYYGVKEEDACKSEPIIIPFNQRIMFVTGSSKKDLIPYPKWQFDKYLEDLVVYGKSVNIFFHNFSNESNDSELATRTSPFDHIDGKYLDSEEQEAGSFGSLSPQFGYIIPKGSYSFAHTKISLQRTFCSAGFAPTWEIGYFKSVLKYTLGQAGIEKIISDGTNTYKVSFKYTYKTFASTTRIDPFTVDKNASSSAIAKSIASIPKLYRDIETKESIFSWGLMNRLISGFEIVKFSNGTILDTMKYEYFKHLQNFHATAITGLKNKEYFLLAVKHYAYADDAITEQTRNNLYDYNYSAIIKVYYDPVNATANRKYIMSNDAENLKDKDYWEDKLNKHWPGYKGSRPKIVLDSAIPSGEGGSNIWFLPLDNVWGSVANNTLIFTTTLVEGVSEIEMYHDYTSFLNFNDEMYNRSNFPYINGDFRNREIYEVAELLGKFNHFEILDIVQVSDSYIAISFFNKRSMTGDALPYGIQIVGIDDLKSSIPLRNHPYSKYLDVKYFSSQPIQLTATFEAGYSQEYLYFGLNGDGLVYCWDEKDSFQIMGKNKPFSFNDSYFNSNLEILEVSDNPKLVKIFGVSAPDVDNIFLHTPAYGEYTVWSLYKQLYAIVELADFTNMKCMDALKLLAESMFYVLGIDNFGNIRIIRRASINNTTPPVAISLNEAEKYYSTLKTKYGVKDIYNKVSVIPYQTEIKNPTWQISSLLRQQDEQIKLTLDIVQLRATKQEIKLICTQSGYIGEDAEDIELQYYYMVQTVSSNKSITLDYTKVDEDNAVVSIPPVGKIGIPILEKTKKWAKFSIKRLRELDFFEDAIIDKGTQWINYKTKQYLGEEKLVNLILEEPIKTIPELWDKIDDIALVGNFFSPQFKFFLHEDIIEVVNVQKIYATDKEIYLSSVYGGVLADGGIKVGYYLVFSDSNTNQNIYRKISNVDNVLNTIEIDEEIGLDVPIKTSMKILPYIDLYSQNRIDIVDIDGHYIYVRANTLLCEDLIVKFYDKDNGLTLNRSYRIFEVFKDTFGNVYKIHIDLKPSDEITPDKYQIEYYFSPQILGNFYKIGNTGIQIKFNAEFPSYPEQRMFKKGESITISCAGVGLKQATYLKQTYINLKSIEKYGERELPTYSQNKFLNFYLAGEKARMLLAEFAFPRYNVSITKLPIMDIDFFSGKDLFVLEIQNSKKFPYSPEYKEKFYLTKITKKGRYVDIEGKSTEPYEK